jgi:dCTP deaminase
MSILVHQEILDLLELGIVKGALDINVGPASLDVHLGDEFRVEAKRGIAEDMVIPAVGTGPYMTRMSNFVELMPGEFCLAATREWVDLPDDISCEFRLRSTVARCGLGHALAVWVDPGFSGNITLELKNELKHHISVLNAGDRVGQLIFHRHAKTNRPYAGAYAASRGVVQAVFH